MESSKLFFSKKTLILKDYLFFCPPTARENHFSAISVIDHDHCEQDLPPGSDDDLVKQVFGSYGVVTSTRAAAIFLDI